MRNKKLVRALLAAGALLLIAAGAVSIVRSMAMPEYKNAAAYNRRLGEISEDLSNEAIDSDTASRQFYENKDAWSTGKYTLYDRGVLYAGTGLLLGCLLLYPSRVWGIKKSLDKFWLHLTAGLALVGAAGGYVIQLCIDQERYTFPSWADSISIPLFGTLILLVIAIPVVTCIVLLLMRGYRGHAKARFSPRYIAIPYKFYFCLVIPFLIWLTATSYITPDFGSWWLAMTGLLFHYMLYIGLRREK